MGNIRENWLSDSLALRFGINEYLHALLICLHRCGWNSL